MKTSKIVDLSKKEFEGKFGKAWNFKLKFENGDEGKIVKKDENALKIGDELTYELQEGEYGNQIKVQRPTYTPKGDQGKARLIVGAMQCAVQMLSFGEIAKDKLETTFDWFYEIMSKKNGN